jgi:hypothetical protein
MKKSILSFFITLFIGGQWCQAQSYIASAIEKTDKEAMQYEVLGKVGSHYWIFKNNAGISTIAQYNEQMQIVKQNDLSFLPKSLNGLEFIASNDQVVIFYQFQVNTTVYAAVAKLNADGKLMGEPKIMDTADKVRPGSGTKVFNLLRSDDHEKILLFSINKTNASAIKVKTISLNKNFELLTEAEIIVQSQNKKSTLSDFALDNKGNLFCLRNITQTNMAPAVSLLYLSADGKEVIESAIVNISLELDDIRLKVDNAKGQVILNSFYATEKKGHIEGLYSYLWDIAAKKEILTNANRFTDYNRGAVSSKRNLKNVFDTYYLDKVTTQTDGSYTVIAEAADSYSNRNNYFSRWDFYWGGAFYNPFMFNYWNRPFGFYPWARFGWGGMGPWGFNTWGMGPWGFNFWGNPFMWGNPFASFGYPSVTYNANKIALLSFDAKGNLQSIKTIDKSQNDQNVDQFIGYGTIENHDGLHFLYHQKRKGQHSFVFNSLTKQGQLEKGAVVMANEKNYEWMPRMLKQVSNHEAILPYQYKSRIGFAKIKFK